MAGVMLEQLAEQIKALADNTGKKLADIESAVEEALSTAKRADVRPNSA